MTQAQVRGPRREGGGIATTEAGSRKDRQVALLPRKELQHYVPQWVLKGFTQPNGSLYAWRISEQRGFYTGPARIFARVNINTALSEDGREVLAYSERAYSWLDQHGSKVAYAVRDAARIADWHPQRVRVLHATPETLSWFTGLPLRQFARTPEEQLVARVADQHGLSSEQRRVLNVEVGMAKLQNSEDVLNAGRPIVLRSSPEDPLVVGDDIVVRGALMENGMVSFLGILVDQHTIMGRGLVRDRQGLVPNEVEVRGLPTSEVEQINKYIAFRAETIAGSQSSLVKRLGTEEGAGRRAGASR